MSSSELGIRHRHICEKCGEVYPAFITGVSGVHKCFECQKKLEDSDNNGDGK